MAGKSNWLGALVSFIGGAKKTPVEEPKTKYEIRFDNDWLNETCTIVINDTHTYTGYGASWINEGTGEVPPTTECLRLSKIWRVENIMRKARLETLNWSVRSDEKWGDKFEPAKVLTVTGGSKEAGNEIHKEVFKPFAETWTDCDNLKELSFADNLFLDQMLRRTELAERLEQGAKVVEATVSPGTSRSVDDIASTLARRIESGAALVESRDDNDWEPDRPRF